MPSDSLESVFDPHTSSHGHSGAELTKLPLNALTSNQKNNCNAILQEMWEMPLRDIAAELTARNIPTPRGGDAWSPMTVMRVMKRLGIAGQ